MKYIIILGGVISGVGKGISGSSIGKVLESMNYIVTYIKIDPYINYDAGTLSPLDHGEVYVLSDGGEVDLDFGTYERLLDISLTKDHSITTGKIYQEVIKREREGQYLGDTVQIVPHLTSYVRERIKQVSQMPIRDEITKEYRVPDVCIIELGGTVEDLEAGLFVESLRRLKNELKREQLLIVGVEYIPELCNNELKTKPLQNSIKKCRNRGIKQDIVICRCNVEIDNVIRNKISQFCEIEPANIFHLPNTRNIQEIPLSLANQGIGLAISKILNLNYNLDLRKMLIEQQPIEINKIINLGIVGKYIKNNDCYLSLINTIKYSANHLKIQVNIVWFNAIEMEESFDPSSFDDVDCVIVPGGFGLKGLEGMITALKAIREKNIPLLGICLGFQMAVIEFGRNVLGIKDANTEEITLNNDNNVIKRMNEDKIYGGTMRLGNQLINIKEDSRIQDFYGSSVIYERHRHRYEVNPEFIDLFEKNGLEFVGKNKDGKRMEIFDLKSNSFYIGVQYHPEFLGRAKRPHCLFTQLFIAALNRNTK